jgi:hypothetical protein
MILNFLLLLPLSATYVPLGSVRNRIVYGNVSPTERLAIARTVRAILTEVILPIMIALDQQAIQGQVLSISSGPSGQYYR